MGASPGALQIEVTGQQFVVEFPLRRPGRKIWPRQSLNWSAPPPAIPSASIPTDPASKDDIVSPVIAVPAGREVELIIRSQDVTHSFFVRELRLKQDAVPGMEIHMHFTATDSRRI